MNLDPLYDYLAEQISLYKGGRDPLVSVGWFNTKTGEMIASPPLEHYKVIAERPEYTSVKERLQEIQEERDQAYQDFCDDMDPDDHPAWHRWTEYRFDEMVHETVKRVFEDGWIRFGLWYRTGEMARFSKLEIESIFPSLPKRQKDFPEYEKSYGMTRRPWEKLAKDLGVYPYFSTIFVD